MPTNSATIQTIADEVAIDILNKQNLVPLAVKQVLNVYTELCGLIPFPELRHLSADQTITVDTSQYSLTSIEPNVAGIISMRYEDANVGRRFVRRNKRLYDAQSTIPSGPPYSYARLDADTLELNPAPNLAATFRLHYWAYPQVTRTDDDLIRAHVLETPQEWNELIMFMALERMYYRLEEPEKAMQLVLKIPAARMRSPKKVFEFEFGIIPRLLNDYLQTIDDRESIDEDFSINPVYRRYTNIRGR